MKGFKHLFAEKRFQSTLIIIVTCCVFFAVLLAAIGFYEIASASIDALTHELLANVVRQISLNIDDHIQQIQSLLISLAMDSEFEAAMEEAAKSPGDIELSSLHKLYEKMLKTQLIRQDIKGLYVFDCYGEAYYVSTSPSLTRGFNLQTESWYKELEETKGVFVVSSHIPERYLVDKTEVFSVVQRLNSVVEDRPMATIVADVELDLFSNIISNIAPSSKCVVLITNANGELVYSNYGTDISGTIAEQIYNTIEGTAVFKDSAEGSFALPYDEKIVVDYTTSQETGWKIICYSDWEEISKITQSLQNRTIFLIVIMVTVAAICTILAIRSQFRVLNNLKYGMARVIDGNYEIQVSPKTDDEIGDLCETFNTMTNRLNYYFNTVDRLEKEKQKDALRIVQAELTALQAQINPHFIYNALETISMMAEINDDYEASQMATSLGKLFHASVKGGAMITVAEELECLENYIYIQKIRFSNKFDVIFEIPEELRCYLIPKLTMQPLVENSIHHGLEQKNGKGRIVIRGKQDGTDLLLEISDDGVGMAEEELAAVQTMLNNSGTENSQSIGLSNVNQRIRLHFGDPTYGLTLQSVQGKGTTITVRIPQS